jgi:tetratricopeptide (TPR) repeat protein
VRVATKEDFFREGHRLFLLRERDSAEVLLRQVVALDSMHGPALKDLAELSYDRARDLEGKESRTREAAMRSALGYFARLEGAGQTDGDTYERLCELSLGVKDYRSFLRYAKKSAEKYPYDRQYYNLGIAYFEAGDYAACVKSQKEAVEKFRASNYIGGFYRQMGRAYMKMDRDQTAERTLATGVQAADGRLAELQQSARGTNAELVRRLTDDKISMLLLLKRLHTIYRAEDKLQKVEQQLKDAGYGK